LHFSTQLECGPLPNVMAALSNIGGALCSTPQSLADAQTPEPISAVSEPNFAILRGRVEEVLLLNNFFRLSILALVTKIQPDKVVHWGRDGDFLRHFCVLYFQRAACSTFQTETCILNSH